MQHKIQITETITIEEFRNEFNSIFPFLKVEFFNEPSSKGKLLSKDKIVQPKETLSNLQKIKKSGELVFTNQTSVGDLEQLLFTEFGLSAQVFRKSGNVWLETSATDSWSLEQQSEEGKSLAQHWNIEKEDPNDHDIY